MAGLCKVYCAGINSKNSTERLFAETTMERRKVNMGAATYFLYCEMAKGGTLCLGIRCLYSFCLYHPYFSYWRMSRRGRHNFGHMWGSHCELIHTSHPYYPNNLHQKMPRYTILCLWVFILPTPTIHNICIRKCQEETETIFGWDQISEYAAEIPLLVVHPVNKAAAEAAPTLGLNW